jgi:hypothetical protein
VRRSGRIPKEVPILLIGSDLDGRVFSEPTTTVLLSLHGAGIVSQHKLSPEQELILRWTEKNKEAEIRVVGHLGSQNGIYTYGVAFFDPNVNFWDIDFPPISEIENQLGLISLVCTSCKTIEKIDDTSVEADVCATNESVLRNCKRCGATTLWKPANAATTPQTAPTAIQRPVPAAIQQPAAPVGQLASAESAQLPLFSASPPPPSPQIPAPPSNSIPAPAVLPTNPSPPAVPQPSFYAQSRDVSPDSPSSSSNFHAGRSDPAGDPAAARPGSVPDAVGESQAAVLTIPPPVQENPAAARINRRKHPRVKVSYSACIRHPQRGDDIVACEDMSKGGLRFTSRKQYYVHSFIEVAVPYQPGQPAIFVPAQIVFVEPLPEQSLFRCGVQYLKSTKPRDGF